MSYSPDDMDEDPYTDNYDGPPEDRTGPSTDQDEDPSEDHPDLDAESNAGDPFDWQQEEYPDDDTEDQGYKASHANSIHGLREWRKQCNTGKTESPGYLCVKCNKTFKHAQTRLQHYRDSINHNVCDHCSDDTDYPTYGALKDHWQKVHRASYCYFCDRHYETKYKRQMHMEREHNPCIQCSKYYKTEENLREHQRTSPKHRNKYCGICDLKFKGPYWLILHQSNNHRTKDGLESDSENEKKRRAKGATAGEKPPDHYATLGVSPKASHEEIVKIAKAMRIKHHPDWVKRKSAQPPSAEEWAKIQATAAQVGWASDILSDKKMREKYDRKLRVYELATPGGVYDDDLADGFGFARE